jgi:imidazolonepropionase-like amidohydrolase|nr:amidohydrolase family protein [Kofleriaceae bacterium]
MRSLLFACAGIVACCPPVARPAQPASAASDTHYSIITVDRPSGSADLHLDADGLTAHGHFTFDDRGRGPDITVDTATDARGFPVTLHATGVAYFKNPVDEQLTHDGGRLTWQSAAEHGSAADTAGFYVSLNDGLINGWQLAVAALHAPDRHVTLLPAGTAWIEDDKIVPITVAGQTRQLHEVALAGLDFTPGLVWLDEHDHLFGTASAWTSMVPAGAESAIPAMLAADKSWLAARAGKLAAKLAHRPPSAGLVFTHAAVFDPESKTLIADRTVIVAGDRIAVVGDASTPIPPGAQVIDAHGRTLLAGLWDMHVHLGDGDGLLDLASGVTDVRDLGNDITDLTERVARFDAGTEVGPRVLRAGLIDGPGKFAAPTGVLASTPDEALAAVKRFADLGYVQIKMYSSLDPALVPIIAKAAHDRGLRVSGHIPNGMTASQAVEAGYDEIQHVNFLFLQFLAGPGDDTRTPLRFTRVAEKAAAMDLGSPEVTAFLDLLVQHTTVLDPTLSTFDGMFVADPGEIDPVLAPFVGRLPAQVERGARGGGLDAPNGARATFRASYAKMLDLVARAWKRGITIVAGTDGQSGLQLARELELYVQAGIPAPDVLAIVTAVGPRVMHVADAGSIAPGKRADLVLVDGDPTRDISTIRNTDVVVCRGVVYDPAELFRAAGMQPRR